MGTEGTEEQKAQRKLMHRGTVSTEKQYAQYIMDNRKTEEDTRRLKANSFKG